MIYGIGHDVVEIERVRQMLSSGNGEKLMLRVLTPEEWDLPARTARSAEFVAGRFAAKEAISKAFGCGIGKVLGFKDINVMPDVHGKPSVQLLPEAWGRLGHENGAEQYVIHLSITHERHLASAFAIVERVK